MTSLRRIVQLGLAILLLTLVAIVGFHLIERWSWFDSLYMVVITLSTIGYGEVHPLSTAGRAFNIVLILAGVGLVFMLVGTMTQALLESQLARFYGRRRMDREIARLNDHYIVCGAGRVGRSVAAELAHAGVPFIVVENAEARMQSLPSGWLTLLGDATKDRTLQQARIEHARGLVAATTTDATNIYIVLTARGLSNRLRIIARAAEEDAEKHLQAVGADQIISPYRNAGIRAALSLLHPHVVDLLDLALGHGDSDDLGLAQVRIRAGSKLDGCTLAECDIAGRMGCIVLAMQQRDGALRFNPAGTSVLHPEESLIVMGPQGELKRLERAAGA